MIQRLHPLYSRYQNMLGRCYYKSNNQYKNYGGRGIKVCDRWRGRGGFKRYVEDIGLPPHPWYSIDRINNDGDYEPSNVRWATPKEQSNNRRYDALPLGVSGIRGVYWSKDRNMWMASILHDGHSKILGYSEDKEVTGKMYRDEYYRLKGKLPY